MREREEKPLWQLRESRGGTKCAGCGSCCPLSHWKTGWLCQRGSSSPKNVIPSTHGRCCLAKELLVGPAPAKLSLLVTAVIRCPSEEHILGIRGSHKSKMYQNPSESWRTVGETSTEPAHNVHAMSLGTAILHTRVCASLGEENSLLRGAASFPLTKRRDKVLPRAPGHPPPLATKQGTPGRAGFARTIGRREQVRRGQSPSRPPWKNSKAPLSHRLGRRGGGSQSAPCQGQAGGAGDEQG